MDTGCNAHHVIHAAIVFRVMRKSKSKCVFHTLGGFLGGALPLGGSGRPLLQLRPLGDIPLTELLGFWTPLQATQPLQRLVAARLQCPVLGMFSFCGVHRKCVGPWKPTQALMAVVITRLKTTFLFYNSVILLNKYPHLPIQISE